MSVGSANTVWARIWADEMARCGVREVALAPGSRSTPLVLALARDDRFRLRVHLDERSAAFFALGVGKASGRPAAVVTTSGSAVANLFPAVVEAAQAETPLLLLTADRPGRLRGADANQAIDQQGIFGSYARAFFDLGPPSWDGAELRHLRVTTDRAVDACVGPPAGPVHVNVPFDKPLEPSEDGLEALREADPLAAGGRADGRPFTRIARGRSVPEAADLDAASRLVDASPRGIVVAGGVTDPARIAPAVLRFAARAGFPVLADPLSGARFGPDRGALRPAAYDFSLRSPEAREALRPDLIVRIGASPTSATLQDWLAGQSGTPYLVLDEGRRWKDHGASVTDYLAGDPVPALDLLAERTTRPADDSWLDRWRAVDRAARTVLAGAGGGAGDGADRGIASGDARYDGAIWPVLARAVPEATVFVSNSMPVRDLDVFGAPDPRSWEIVGNRGASGIDGIVSTAFGVAAARSHPVLCVLGDLALFHDQNGLLWSREPDLPVVFILVDNDGGGIFHMLPIADHEPDFTRYFATPHGLDFRHAAALHGIEFREPDPASLEAEVRAAIASGTTRILRFRSDRVESRARRTAIAAAVVDAVRGAIERLA